MSDFWQELAQSTKTEQRFDTARQQAYQAALDDAKALYEEIMQKPEEQDRYGVTVQLRERVVSFRKNGTEILAVVFGADGRDMTRIYGPVMEYLKLDPSFEEFRGLAGVSQKVARWLARSLEAIRQNEEKLRNLGLV
jgi:hypothetical protein